jgi:hypothetical protein
MDELHGLRKLLTTAEPATPQPGGPNSPDTLRSLVAAEIASVKQRLIDKVLTIEDEGAIRRFLHIHQYGLISIMDEVAGNPLCYAAFECHEQLDELLSFFQQQFFDYFNAEAAAPVMHLAVIRAESEVHLHRLTKVLEKSSAHTHMVEMVLYPIMRLHEPRTKAPTFNRIRHVRYIFAHLERIHAQGCQGTELNAQLLQMLLYLNYNSKKTFTQMTTYIRSFLNGDADLHQKIVGLSTLRKEVNQATVKQGTGYHMDAPTFKSQLANYLTEELDYLSHIKNPPESADEKADPRSAFKLKLGLSVAQLGCLLRILIDTGLIACGNIVALIRFVASHCETRKTGAISAESLRIKYYNIERGAHEAVCQKLTEVLKAMGRT